MDLLIEAPPDTGRYGRRMHSDKGTSKCSLVASHSRERDGRGIRTCFFVRSNYVQRTSTYYVCLCLCASHNMEVLPLSREL